MELIKSRRLPLILGLLFSAAFTGLAALATTPVQAVTCIALSMFCMQFGITCKWILVTAVTPQAYVASAAANQNFAGFLGGTLLADRDRVHRRRDRLVRDGARSRRR